MPRELAAPELTETHEKLINLVDYVRHLVELGQKPVFSVNDYKQLLYHEVDLKNRIGILHDLSDEDGAIWLKIDRLKRIEPPEASAFIRDWIAISRDPYQIPKVWEIRTETLDTNQAHRLVKSGILDSVDVQSALKTKPDHDQVDVIYRLGRLPAVKCAIDQYLSGPWTRWSEREKPRRETIAIYDKFFTTYQTLVSEGGDEPLELVWGVGVARWRIGNTEIDHPLIEQLVELQVDMEDGSITVRPRSTEPQLALKPYFALENAGADTVLNFGREFLSQCPAEEEFSPFVSTSFEPVLRQAVTHLDQHGQYHADQCSDVSDRSVPETTQTLTITDTWAVYARRRSDNFFIADLESLKEVVLDAEHLPETAERLATEPSDENAYQPAIINLSGGLTGYHKGTGGSVGGGRLTLSDALVNDDRWQDFFFPKPFNDEQITIIQRLSNVDGVVVQGPPGTGKTHTIANIICHYLATGKRVLVTSQKESALSVLRDHIPDSIRDLGISLLTNERTGLKQLETAVRLIANTASTVNPRKLERDIVASQERIIELQTQTTQIETELREWTNKHLRRINGPGQTIILPMELAKQVVSEREQHAWFQDRLSAEAVPQFNDEDIALLRQARKAVAEDLTYLNAELPVLAELPDAATLAAIHQDLLNAQALDQQAQTGGIAILSLSSDNAIERAGTLLQSIHKVIEFYSAIEDSPWLEKIFTIWRQEGFNSEKIKLFTDLTDGMEFIHSRRLGMLRAAITVPDAACSNSLVIEAVMRAAEGSRPFGLLPFGKSEARQCFSEIRILGRVPRSFEEWHQIADYLKWRRNISSLVTRWNHLRSEYDMPTLADEGEATARWISELIETINAARDILIAHAPVIAAEVPELFPYGLNAQEIIAARKAAEQAIEAIELNLSKHRLAASRNRVADLRERLTRSTTPVTTALLTFISEQVGNAALSVTHLTDKWEDLCRELMRLNDLRPALATIKRVTAAIESSGARQWADVLRCQPVTGVDDPWTPGGWRKSWEWARHNTYLQEIDGRARIQKLSEDLLRCDEELKKTFQKVVELRTYLGLMQSLTDRVKSALTRFMTAIQKIGKGTGVRARRFRRNARDAMELCYSAVPCWIMPIWRVSESLPVALASFDLVIVDEASQCDITSLPALIRGKKLLIVGDDKQVSPTGGFIEERKILQLRHNYLKNQPYADLVLPGGSLYALAQAMFPGERILLREHFRCVEPIIRFSFQFYAEDLIPLRLPAASERLDPPLIDVYVTNGHKDHRNINVPEAEAIVDEIERLVTDTAYMNRSIGVISLIGARQAHYIQGLLLERIGEEAFLRHQIACGASATFQGKERDIMFISMVACPQSKSALTALHFEQRFNVALSRARDLEYLFRSVTEEMLKPEDLKAKVIRHFQSPMPVTGKHADDLFDLCDSDFEQEVLRRLLDLGYHVTPQLNVGGYSIDLVVEGTEGRRLAIELDGDKYHPPERWGEDFARQRVLERVGWTFWRCWGSSFALNPEACMEDLVSRLTEMRIEPIGGEQIPTIYSEHRTFGPQASCKKPSLIEPNDKVKEETEEVEAITSDERAERVAGEAPTTALQRQLDLT